MKEIGILNSGVDAIISNMGHMDEMIVCDAGFPIPLGVKVVDLAIAENKPTVFEFLEVLKKYFSAEKLIFAKETKEISPSMYQKISSLFDGLPVETISHVELKKRSKYVKAIIRTGDFTAFTNVLLISGAGDRWYIEKK
jgi:D-ribose pyranase